MWAQQTSATGPAFETASIRPSQVKPYCGSFATPGSSHFDSTCLPLRAFVQIAFVSDNTTFVEGNQHALDTPFDIHATTSDGVAWTYESVRPMLQQLLIERFHLAYHFGNKLVPGYEMVLAKGGTRLTPLPVAPPAPGARTSEPPKNFIDRGRIQGPALDADGIASMLSVAAHQPVINKTQLSGLFKLDLRFDPDDSTATDLPSFFTATKEQLGLELKPAKVTVQTVVIDHIDDSPTEN